MRLRSQLLVVSLLTLALPWAGWQFVREMETALRDAQQRTLLESAAAIAAVLAAAPDLLVRDPVQRIATRHPERDLYAHTLPGGLVLDGFAREWGLPSSAAVRLVGPPDGPTARLLIGRQDEDFWLHLEVEDADIVYRTPAQPDNRFDHVLLEVERPDGSARRITIEPEASGEIIARQLDDDGALVPEPRARVVWTVTADGYQAEMRLRGALVGARLGVAVIDADDRTSPTRRVGTFPDGERPGLVTHRLQPLEAWLRDFRQRDRELLVTDQSGWELAAIYPQGADTADANQTPLLEAVFRRIVEKPATIPARAAPGRVSGDEVNAALAGEPAARWYRTAEADSALVSAAQPIRNADGAIQGALVVRQNSRAILTLTYRVLARLLALTLFATAVAALGLLGFATVLSLRIRRLSQAAEHAMSPEGQIRTGMPGTDAGDELGDLSRSFAGLLDRLHEYTEYLRTLAGKLAHELRTPLAVVRSSLDNLDAGELPAEARVYAGRARDGAMRLGAIFVAMTEATRVEQSIETADVETFNLRAVVAGCVQGYRDVAPDRRIELVLPEEECLVRGVPELIAQMLDKLVDNARDFSPAQGRIEVRLENTGNGYRLAVSNEGPALPAQMRRQLFDSMVSLRERRDDAPHLGLGLHIARLIAEFHGGRITADNLPGNAGAVFTVSLPAVRTD